MSGRDAITVVGVAWLVVLAGLGLSHLTGASYYLSAVLVIVGGLGVLVLLRLIVLAVEMRTLHRDFLDACRSWDERRSDAPEAVARRERLRRKYGER